MSLPGSATGVVVRTVPLGGGSLSRAIQAGSAPAAWQLAWPRDRAAWTARADAVRAIHDGAWCSMRSTTRSVARTRPPARVAERAAHGVVVTTGQQPGLFGGPAYTITKALSALALADALESALGMPVAPVFWAATDDADWREASVTVHVVGEHGLVALSQDGPPGPTGSPCVMFRWAICAGNARRCRHPAVRRGAGGAGATRRGVCRRVYRGFGLRHSGCAAVLEPLGISVLDAAHPSTRRALDPAGCVRRCRRDAYRCGAACSHGGDHCGGIHAAGRVGRWIVAGVRHVDGVRTRVPIATHRRRRRRSPWAPSGRTCCCARSSSDNCCPPWRTWRVPANSRTSPRRRRWPTRWTCRCRSACRDGRPTGSNRTWSGSMDRLGVTDEELRDPHAPETRSRVRRWIAMWRHASNGCVSRSMRRLVRLDARGGGR
jgi:hypothetical protein